MHRLAKVFLLCLLMLAAPLQGFAAASGILCGAAQQHALSANANGPHAAHHVHDAGVEQANDSSDQDGTSRVTLICSSCAMCCVGGFIPPSVPKLSAVQHARLAEPAVPGTHYSGYIPEGLKRPPRSLLS